MADNDLNEQFEEELDDATVITVPIDATLSNSGEAADAKAVGDALAQKADLSSVVTIDVNGQEADAQGHIALNAGNVPMSGTDETTVAEALESITGQTGETIPMNSETGAPTIAEAVAEAGGRTGETIPVRNSSTTMIAAKIDAMDASTNANTSAITELQGRSGETIMVSGESSTSIKDAIGERVLMVNGERSDASGNVRVDRVPIALNLESDENQTVTEEFTQRATGGEASVSDGGAWLLDVRGNRIQQNYVPESLEMETEGCTAAIDRDAFVAEVGASGTITLTYNGSDWSTNPETYGITVSGEPAEGATITVVYVAEERGTITVTDPDTMVATGWNLYNHANGYAQVTKYSDEYGYGVAGEYTKLEFAQTPNGARTVITPESGLFTVPSDGYVIVTGGNNTSTAIWMTWRDWEAGYAGDFEAYRESTVDLSGVMDECFPYGLLMVGDVRDEINLSTGIATSWIERMAYSGANRAIAEASGRAYEVDEDNIYLVRAEPVETEISVNNEYTVSDHGIERFSGQTVPVLATSMYGNNLKNKLERDVLTISQQSLTAAQKTQVQENLGLSGAMEVVDGLGFLGTFVKSIPSGNGIKLKIQGGATAYWLAISMSTTTTYRGMWLLCRQGSNGRTTATPVLDSSVVSITGSQDASEFIVSKNASSTAYICLISLYSSGSKMPDIVTEAAG